MRVDLQRGGNRGAVHALVLCGESAGSLMYRSLVRNEERSLLISDGAISQSDPPSGHLAVRAFSFLPTCLACGRWLASCRFRSQ